MIARVSPSESIVTLTVGSQLLDVSLSSPSLRKANSGELWKSVAISRLSWFRSGWQWSGTSIYVSADALLRSYPVYKISYG